MTPHPLSADLQRFVRGTLSCPGSRRIIAHLLRGCSDCGTALAGYAGFVPSLTHGAPETSYGESFERSLERAQRTVEIRREAAAVLASLFVGDTPREGTAQDAPACHPDVSQVAALLQSGRAQRHDNPARMLHFSRLASSAADRLSESLYGTRTVADFRGLAWAELGNAYRVVHDLDRAGRALDCALYWIRRGSRSSLLQARLAVLFASLFIDQRRFVDARKLLDQAHDIYTANGNFHLAGRALISAGHLAATAAAPGEAITLSHQGLALVDYRRDPQLVFQTLRNMIDCLVELGEFRAARRQLWRARVLFTTNAHRLDLLRLRWLEGRIYAGIGDVERAEVAFRDTRSGFIAARQIFPAALAALELATLWARQGRNHEVQAVAGELVSTFRALGIAREAIGTLLVLQRACELDGRVVDLIEAAAAVLRELQHRPVRLPA